MGRYHFVFPRWSNLLLPAALVFGATAPLYVVFLVAFGFSPKTTDVGYEPTQPVPYSHALHVGELGIDCRYCHNTVEDASHAAIPPTSTCMNCHTQIHPESELLEPVRTSWETGEPVPWVRIHDLPDYAYFNHAAHVNRGVSCVSCHGRVDRMDVVWQHEPLSMGWCLECHRNPDEHLRDPALATELGWDLRRHEGGARPALYRQWWKEVNQVNPAEDCSDMPPE